MTARIGIRPQGETNLDPGDPPEYELAKEYGKALLYGDRETTRMAVSRHFWNDVAESLLIEAFNEALAGHPAERQRMIDELRTRDDAELGRLVRENVEPYLDHEKERYLP